MAKLPSITQRYGDVDFRQTGPLFTKENYAQFKSNYVKLRKGTAPFDSYEKKSKSGTLVLGQGRFGTVALARDTLTGKKVAIKASKQESAVIGLYEGLVLDQARHKNIIEVYDVFTAQKTKVVDGREVSYKKTYVVMERAGRSLYQRMVKKETFSEAAIRRMVKDMLEGVNALHKAGYTHGDFAERNVVFVGRRAKILDFGSSRNFDANKARNDLKCIVEIASGLMKHHMRGGISESAAAFRDLRSSRELSFEALMAHPWLQENSGSSVASLFGMFKTAHNVDISALSSSS